MLSGSRKTTWAPNATQPLYIFTVTSFTKTRTHTGKWKRQCSESGQTIAVSPQPPAPQPKGSNKIFQDIKSVWKIDTSRGNATGCSHQRWCALLLCRLHGYLPRPSLFLLTHFQAIKSVLKFQLALHCGIWLSPLKGICEDPVSLVFTVLDGMQSAHLLLQQLHLSTSKKTHLPQVRPPSPPVPGTPAA